MELYDILSENLSRLRERRKIMRHLMSEGKEIDLFWPILIFASHANTIKVNLLFSFNCWITHCSMCSVRWGSGLISTLEEEGWYYIGGYLEYYDFSRMYQATAQVNSPHGTNDNPPMY